MSAWTALFAVLFLSFLWLVIGFFLRSRNNEYRSRWVVSDVNEALLRQRAQEIEGEIAAEGIDQSKKSALVDEFGATVIGDIDPVQSERGHEVSQMSFRTAISFSLVLIAIAWALYLRWGDPGAEEVRDISMLMSSNPDQEVLEDIEARLFKRVAARPDDRDTWIYLAYVLLGKQDYKAAVGVFAEIERLGSTVELDNLWLIATFQELGGLLGPEGKKIAARILRVDPDHLSTLELLVMDAVRSGSDELALVYLEKILAQPVNKARRRIFEEMVSALRDKLPSTRAQLAVSVDTGFRDMKRQWLVVTARDPASSAIIAVVKRPLDERRQYAVTIDDAVLVNPDKPLSLGNELVVNARLAVSDLARKGPQDIEHIGKTVSIGEDTEVEFFFTSFLDASPSKGVGVSISLGANVLIPPTTPIFVVARAERGNRVPIAVRRLEARELPVEILLSDQDSMVQTRSLTDFEDVEVIARAALGGRPVATKGDYESKPTLVDIGGETTIVIDTLVTN